MRLDAQLADLSRRQHGHIAIRQIAELGASRQEIYRLPRSSQWERVTHRVLRRVGLPMSPGGPLMAAVLDAGPGAVLSHRSAASWWGLPGFRESVADVSSLAPTNSTLAKLHEVRALPTHWLTTLDGIPVVRPELFVYQLCGCVHPLRAARALDNAWSMRLLSGPSLRRLLEELAEHGRNGTVVLRTLLDARVDEYVPPATGLEARFQQLLEDAGLPSMRRQVDTGDAAHWIGRVDCVDDELPLIIEIQSERFHRSLVDEEADTKRIAALTAAGYVVECIWDIDVWHNRTKVLAQVRSARERARRHARSAPPASTDLLTLAGQNEVEGGGPRSAA